MTKQRVLVRLRLLGGGLLFIVGCGMLTIAQTRLEFEVASIKPNVSGAAGGDTRRLPDGTFAATNISIRNLLGSAWPTGDFEYHNLPGWAISNRYDITVKPPADTSPAQLQEMWRTFFKDRLRLEAHNEMRDAPIYALVVAHTDGRLGPQIKKSPHDCSALAAASPPAASPRSGPPSENEVMSGCGSLFLQGRMMTGGMLLSTFARSLGGSMVGRLVDDRTELDGYYAFTLTYAPPARSGADAVVAAGDAPSIFTALREQLGLKLEPARKPVLTVVIDHIEPPTEN
jgi:uncharacterized protein (TIGR03435 family)